MILQRQQIDGMFFLLLRPWSIVYVCGGVGVDGMREGWGRGSRGWGWGVREDEVKEG